MAWKNDGGPARGMTLRDWFAGQALAGMASNPRRDGPYSDYAEDAYEYADAMLSEREKSDGE